MHRLVPQFIQEQVAAGRQAGSFNAATLFVDISGFTPITDAIMGHGQHGAEVLAGIIGAIFDPLVTAIFEQGGFVTNFAGDAFTAVFPAADHQSPDQVLPALAAAWQMQREMASSAAQQTPYGDFNLSVKIGLSLGQVAWGVISSADNKRSAYYFQGPAIDGCAGAQKLAQAGQVVVDAAVFQAAGSAVTAKPLDDHFQITAIEGELPDPGPVNLEPLRPEIVNRFYPPEASQQAVSGEFRQVASMFVSLPTVRTVDLLEGFMQIIFELQDRYGGLLNRLDFGDKGANLLLFWGAPIAYENDVTRALNFILDLQSRTVVPVNAGVTYGIAHGGYSGGALAGEYTCHGRGTTLAARLMEAAPRGEIWVDGPVAERARRYFEVDFEEAMPFKGFAQEQDVYVLLERREAGQSFYEGRMVGRQAEQQQLADFMSPLWQGQSPGALVVRGEAGIGKSRLVDAFIRTLQEDDGRDFALFLCQSDEILRESLNPFRYWMRGYLGQSEGQSEARNKRSFNRKLDRLIAATVDEALVAELDRTRSFLGALVNLHWPDSLYEQLDAQARYENTFSALLALLWAESRQRPLILLLEDAQWLDADSKAFLKRLLPGPGQGSSAPIALLATARTEGEAAVLGQDVAFESLTLDQISPEDQALLAEDQLGAPIAADLLALLVERAEGNPFFGEQILRYLQEQESLSLEDGCWQLKARQETALPADVQAVLVARLDRLAHTVRDVVQTASILGREFEIKLLAEMLHDDPALPDKVVEAEQMAIWTAIGELRYLFRHALLRDAAYRMQLRARRQALHEMAVAAMEKLYSQDLSPHYGELAYHAERALQTDLACRYLELAGETAAEAYQNSAAIDYDTRALHLAPDEDLERRFELLRARAELYARIGDRHAQAADLDDMTHLAGQLGHRDKQVTVLISRAWMAWWSADYDQALATAQEAAAMAQAAGLPDLAARAGQVSAWSLLQLERYEQARPFAEKSLRIARQLDQWRLEADALNILAFVQRASGDYHAFLLTSRQALALNQENDSLHGRGTALGNLGVAHMILGDYGAADDCFRQALAINREVGSRVHMGSNLVNLAWNAQTQGECEAAVAYAEDGLAILRAQKHAEMVAEALLWLGHARFGLGQMDEALAAYDESLRLRRQLGQEALAMGVLAGQARMALARGDLESAVDHAAQIVAFLDGGGSLDGVWEPLRLYLTCHRVLKAAGDARANELLQVAHRKLQAWADRIPDPEIRRAYLDNVPWHREITTAYREIDPGN